MWGQGKIFFPRGETITHLGLSGNRDGQGLWPGSICGDPISATVVFQGRQADNAVANEFSNQNENNEDSESHP